MEDFCHLEWAGKDLARMEAEQASTAFLRPEEDLGKDWAGTQNMFIEGDSLEALRILQKDYRGQVRMIYIDPPYNTGKDFEYRDKFSHSRWLNLMYPRLRLARNLLQEEGVIFISIDDHEVHHLRCLCDEIFGEENFLGIFTNCSTPNARDYGHIGKMHEFCLYYAKNNLLTKTNLLKVKDKRFKYKDERGGFNIHPLYNSNVAFTDKNRPNLYYPFYLDPETPLPELGEGFYAIGLTPGKEAIEIFPPRSVRDGVQFVWRWGREKSAAELNREIVGYCTVDRGYRIVQKMRTDTKLIRSILREKEFSSRRGTAELEEIFGRKIFSFPKPLQLISHFARAATDKDSLVLDFFAGSATTAHAVMHLNAEDGGRRRFICVELGEPTAPGSEAAKAGFATIADIGRERIRRAGVKLEALARQTNGKPLPDGVHSRLDTGFRAYRVEKNKVS